MGYKFQSAFSSEQIESAIGKILNGVTWNDLDSSVQSEIEAIVDTKIQQYLVFSTYTTFPEIGSPSVLYIAKDELSIYIWDNEKYLKITGNGGSGDITNIDLIDCGGA